MTVKTCSKCNRELPATTEFFSPNKTGTYGLYSICRKCKQPIDCERRKTRDKKKELEQKKEYYKNNRDRLNSLAKLHNYIRKIKVKQQTCTICNEEKKLQLASIDHIYTENPKDYIWLCQSCHHLYDSSRGEKELPNRENGLNHSYGINGEPNVHHSKLPDYCEECGGYRMGERMMHNDWCSQCTTSTTTEKLPEPKDFYLGEKGFVEIKPKETDPEKVVEPSLDLWEKNTITVICPYCHQGYYLAPKSIEERVRGATRKELIEDIQDDLDSLNPGIPYAYEPLNKIKKKWQGRIK